MKNLKRNQETKKCVCADLFSFRTSGEAGIHQLYCQATQKCPYPAGDLWNRSSHAAASSSGQTQVGSDNRYIYLKGIH